MTETNKYIPEVELKGSRSLSNTLVTFATFIFIVFIYDTGFFSKPKPTVSDWIFFIFWALVFLLSWLFFFDKSKVIINDIGILWKTRFFVYNKNRLLKWQDVDTCYLSDKSGKGVKNLILNFTPKNSDKLVKLSLNAYDKSAKEINDIIEDYSEKYQFGFLGIDD